MSSGPTDNVVEELVAQLLGAALALEDDVADETERNHTDVEAVPERTHSDDETVLDPFEPDALTCAICLESVPPPDMASVKGCDHMYCGKCILHWVVVKESNLCPQCKRPFDHLVVYRQLDGTVTDYPVEESVALLKRASWFTSYLQVHEKETVAKLMQTATHTPGPARTSSGDGGQVGELWDQYVYEYFEEQYDDDEELEDYYLRRARNRVVLGNRRWGENGYVRSGRMHARPASGGTASSSAGSSSAGGSSAGSSSSSGSCSSRPAKSLRSKGKNKPHPSCKPMPISGPRGSFSPAAAGKEAALSSSPGSSAALGTSPSGEGRRARRKARRAMADSATGGVTMPEMEP